MKDTLYKFFVSNNETIKRKYEYFKLSNPERHKKHRICSWGYLFGLNLIYGSKKKHVAMPFPEGQFTKQISLEKYKEYAATKDVLSFDVFDTLLLRSVMHPTDVFSIIAIKTGISDFKKIRIDAEEMARNKSKNNEVTIDDIYANIVCFSENVKKQLKDLEFETECSVCYANPYVKQFFDYAISAKKTVIAVSDNYWPSEKLRELLARCGYTGFSKIYVSCDYSCSKATGCLQKNVIQEYPAKTFLHLDDTLFFDNIKTPKWISIVYKNIAVEGHQFRVNLPTICGNIYNAIVNAKLHCGLPFVNDYYEFGYTYGGFLSYGYCQFIDNYVKNQEDAVILFTARDSEAFYNIYKKFFNHCESKYIYCSREAMIKSSLPYSADMFYDVMFQAKTNLPDKLTIEEALEHAGIKVNDEWFDDYPICKSDYLTNDVLKGIKEMVFKHINEIADSYSANRLAAKEYLKQMIGEHKKVYIVDLGWRGTVYSLIRYLISEIDPTSSVEGFLVGSFDSDMAKVMVEQGGSHSYAFSHAFNQNSIPVEIIMIVETLFSSYFPTTREYKKDEDGNAIPVFAKDIICDLHTKSVYDGLKNGIYDFCKDYDIALNKIGINSIISGADAFAPMKFVCRNYEYIMHLFNELKISDLVGETEKQFASVLNRLGYRQN